MPLEIRNLTKQYNKHKTGLSDYSITIERGILGLLGPNGAGKSTLMKIIATISKPTNGTLFLDGQDIVSNPDYIRKMLGYLPQDFGVYPNLNAYEFLAYVAALKGVGGAGLTKRIDMLLDGVNLTADAKRPIGSYSGGMKQRIGIAQALLNDPKVLIFDEPTVGLDPEERVRFRQLISDMATDCIIILSSHIVSDIETIADEVAVMQGGNLLQKGTKTDIIKLIDGRVFETLIDNSDLTALKARHLVIDTSRQKELTKVRYIIRDGIPEPSSAAINATLEDAYLFLTHNKA
ncbi:ABC transporter ATP-binding protein [Mucilaginibacter sp. L3T2-6]|uniref:ABC transporter ATP-binding protein n=1 Tax=Mucilaginibacter sp. L3T2-6 TaxID=3062491 RepID=UPI0026744E3F|nr:ABC transporter ATP-binding protein [Mucilaginibacter sp. L3T2-6]MDO3642398.1 ABC transporter ATP-binding protein [Mucilaginibacter sp. L3T2-6]MDV6214893.1 ABC transporter ATP-binding protein [Mucilaginibacter sp. L3T2-6]